jgi:hypothetical protein
MRSITAPSTIRKTLLVVAAMLMILLALTPVTPASATGFGVWACDPYWYRAYSGESMAGGNTWAYTDEGTDNCGTVGVKEKYRLWDGGPTSWTAWKYDAEYARVSPGGIGVAGAHYVSGYSGWPSYTHYT